MLAVFVLLAILGFLGNFLAFSITVALLDNNLAIESNPFIANLFSEPKVALLLSSLLILFAYSLIYVIPVKIHLKIYVASFLTALLIADLVHNILVFDDHYFHATIAVTIAALIPVLTAIYVDVKLREKY